MNQGILPRSSAFVRVRRTRDVPRTVPVVPSTSRAHPLARVAVRRSSRVASPRAVDILGTPTARFDWRAVVTRGHLLSPHSSPSPSLSFSLSLSLCPTDREAFERSVFELDRARETAARRAEDRPRW